MCGDCDGAERRRLRIRALDTVDQIGATSSLAELYALLETAFRAFEVEHFIISGIPLPHERLERAVVLRAWPKGWFEMYLREDFVRVDPIVHTCQTTTMPFDWREAKWPGNVAGARQVMNAARDFGLLQGFSLPIHGLRGTEACVSIGGRKPWLDAATRPALHLLAMYAYEQARKLSARQAETAKRRHLLTKREREILTWAAVGKSHTEISAILGITVRTVTAHSINAAYKLGAANKTQAVVKAMQASLIRV